MTRAARRLRGPEPPVLADRLVPDGLAPGARFADFELRDHALAGDDLANLFAPRASLLRVAFTGVRLTGAECGEADLQDVAFAECRLDLASLRFARLQRVRFSGCDLRELDLAGARGRDVVFEDCDLRGVTLANAELDRWALRRCRLDGLRGPDGLRRARMEPADVVAAAGLLAAALGIELVDE